jgi:hypothetical protein
MKVFWSGVLVAFALLTGCDSNTGNEYIGTWEAMVEDGRLKLQYEISRNGENFLLRHTVGEYAAATNPATYKDGTLQAPKFALVIDKKSGKLLSNTSRGTVEYTRVK